MSPLVGRDAGRERIIRLRQSVFGLVEQTILSNVGNLVRSKGGVHFTRLCALGRLALSLLTHLQQSSNDDARKTKQQQESGKGKLHSRGLRQIHLCTRAVQNYYGEEVEERGNHRFKKGECL